jgi:hypothetical protein
MKKETKQQAPNPQEEMDTVKDVTRIENGQPVPQPKDYDEIDY